MQTYDTLVERLFAAFPARNGESRARIYAETMRKKQIPLEFLELAVDGLIATWEKPGLPPIALLLRRATEARIQRERTLREAEHDARALHRMTTEDMQKARRISALGKRGVHWLPQLQAFGQPGQVPSPEDFGMPEARWDPPDDALDAAWDRYGHAPRWNPGASAPAGFSKPLEPDTDALSELFD